MERPNIINPYLQMSRLVGKELEFEMVQHFVTKYMGGWGFWVVEKIDDKKFMGFVGLNEPTYKLPVSPCVEVGWKLAKEYWGCGFASEAAKASLAIAFKKLDLPEVYSFTSVLNKKSQAVMERIGMVNMNQNFDHPMMPKNSPLMEHVFFRIEKSHWEKIRKS